MKTGRDANRSGWYISDCCLKRGGLNRRSDVPTLPELLCADGLGICKRTSDGKRREQDSHFSVDQPSDEFIPKGIFDVARRSSM